MLRTITLIFALSLILAVAVDAHTNLPFARRHAPAANRMIKKRASSAGESGPIINVAPPPAPSSSPTTNTDSASSSDTSTSILHLISASPSSAAATHSAASTPLLLTPQPNPVLTSVLSSVVVVGPTPSNVSSPSPSSTLIPSSSSSSPLTVTPPSSSSSLSQSTLTTPSPQTVLSSVDPVTITSSTTPPASTAGATSSGTVTKLQRNTIIILIVIGGSIGAAGIIWTIIRKWKFSPSRSSDDRLQPIDWQPTTAPQEDRDMTERLTRNASTRSHGSFTSGNHNHDNLVSDLPPHDFTAGPAYLTPVGGYADLQRGPSPRLEQHNQNFQAPTDYHYEIPNPHGQYYNGAGVGAGAGGYQGGFDYNRGY